VFENGVLRKIFGQKRVGIMGDWRKLHKEKLRDLYSSSNTILVIKLRGMRWTGHVARMWDNINEDRVLDEETIKRWTNGK
jgi:hypothetical protein